MRLNGMISLTWKKFVHNKRNAPLSVCGVNLTPKVLTKSSPFAIVFASRFVLALSSALDEFCLMCCLVSSPIESSSASASLSMLSPTFSVSDLLALVESIDSDDATLVTSMISVSLHTHDQKKRAQKKIHQNPKFK